MAVNNADIANLERKQHELKRELDRKNALINAERQKIVNENRQKLIKLQQETSEMIRERDEAVLQNYNAVLENNVSEVSERLQNEFNEYHRQYDEVCLQINAAYAAEQKKTEDILIQQKNFEKIYFNRLESAKNTALKIMNDVIAKVNSAAENVPVEWFMRGHLELYRSHLRDMQNWIELGFYESSIGAGNNIMLSLELDILETKERFYKWFHYYMFLHSVIESERILIFDKARVVPDEFRNFIKIEEIVENIMDDETIEKWSGNRFSALKENYRKFSEEIESFRTDGSIISDENAVIRYMIEHPEKSSQFREMWLYNQGIKALEKRKNTGRIINEMFDKIRCFEERINIAKSIKNCLKNNEYVYEIKEMSPPSENSLYIYFADSYGFDIEVIIVPVLRKSDNKWANFVKCYFSTDTGRERYDSAVSCISDALSKYGISIMSKDKIRTGQTKEERIKVADVDIRLSVNGRLN
ncbi:MAG: hypothetical protein NC177_12375 [Ruminococcus flavefaciens]|nr:hypothetical protein [Ruminococcus flavefaciens]